MIDEKWLPIPGNGAYKISDHGAVQNGKGQRLNPKPNQFGYLVVGLWSQGVARTHQVHRLVALAFLENPKGLPVVHHRDGNRANNRVENLEWATFRTNRQQQLPATTARRGRPVIQESLDGRHVKTWISAAEAAKALSTPPSNISSCCRRTTNTAAGFKWRFAETADSDPDEQWKDVGFKGQTIRASNLGRIQTRTGHITRGTKRGNYLYVYDQAVHRLVATAFCGEPQDGKNEVNHLDGDGENNVASNLQWADRSENMKHAYYGAPEGKCSTRVLRPVLQVLSDGTDVRFPSIAAASRATGILHGHISQACAGIRRSAGGFEWEYDEQQLPLVPEPIVRITVPDDDPLWDELGL